MASNYPGSLDSFDTIASDKKTSDSVGGRTHRDMHNDAADAIEAVQAELGTDPAGTFSTVKARLDALVAYAAKTSAYTATAADHTLNVTSGTFTVDLPAASTCAGQSLKVKNSGTGVVTLDGNSSETVEGVATFPLGRGSYVEITSTGSVWILTGGAPDTGWRNVAAGLLNGWVVSGSDSDPRAAIRRVGRQVFLHFALDGTSATNNAAYTLPAGFTETPLVTINFSYNNGGVGPDDGYIYSYGVNLTGRHGASRLDTTYLTNDAWPTSLPGTAV